MASSINTVVVSGRVTRDTELRHTKGGTPVANNGIAVERYNKEDPENPFVSFFNFTAFGGFAELLARKLKKGDPITLEGRLEQRSWEAEDGSKRSVVEVIANNVIGDFLFRSKSEDNDVTAEGGAPAADAADDDIPF
jgi:single-strand DNA-binding protein